MSTVSWDGGTYAQNTAHHRAFDDVVLAGLELASAQHVLDVGCGAGDLTRTLLRAAPAAQVRGVDADPSMVLTAAAGVDEDRLSFAVAPVQRLADVVEPGWADVIVSVATLHWVPCEQQSTALAQLHAALRPGGWLRIDMGGTGQIADTRAILDEEARRLGGGVTPWFFPEPGAYRSLLIDAGFARDTLETSLVRQCRSMPDEAAIRGWLASQVSIAYRDGLPAAAWDDFENACAARICAELRRSDGSYDQDYVRLHVTARRPV